MAERYIKIQNVGPTDLPEHPSTLESCPSHGCGGCEVPTWNRQEFPMKKGQVLLVQENVGNHLSSSRRFQKVINVVGSPMDMGMILQSPEGMFQKGTDGTLSKIEIKTNTPNPTVSTVGENLADVKKSGRFIATAGE